MAEFLIRAIGYLLQAILEAFVFSAFPTRGQKFHVWWSKKSLFGKLITSLSWLFWALVAMGLVAGLILGLTEKTV